MPSARVFLPPKLKPAQGRVATRADPSLLSRARRSQGLRAGQTARHRVYWLAAEAGAWAAGAAGAGAAAGLAGSAWVASAPCFSPPMSISPPLLKMNKAKPANTTKPKAIFHIPISLTKKAPGQRACQSVRAPHVPRTAFTHSGTSINRWRRCPRPWFP